MGVDTLDIMDVWCLGSLREFASLCGLSTCGGGWKLSDETAQRKYLLMVNDMKSLFVLGSPSCAVFCQLQNLRRGSAKHQATIDTGISSLEIRDDGLQNSVGSCTNTPGQRGVGNQVHDRRFCDVRRQALLLG